MGGDSVASDIREARNDSSIRAIVLRVDSGGGSVVASEVIRREVELAHGQKPVVVSMSDVAASGGYWIATPARKSSPTQIRLQVRSASSPASSIFPGYTIFSGSAPITSPRATMPRFFPISRTSRPRRRPTSRNRSTKPTRSSRKGVAKGRGMTVEAVDKIGKGREWSGAQGKDLGLVDEIGGFDRAIEVAKDLAHIPAKRIGAHRAISGGKEFHRATCRARKRPVDAIALA